MNRLIITGYAKYCICLVSFFCVSCTTVSEKKLFRFPIKEVPDVSRTEKISVEKVFSETLDLTGFALCENKLIVPATFKSDYCLDIIDMASSDPRKQICRKGRGPEEFLSVFPLFSVTDESVIVYDGGTGKVSEVNVVGENPGEIAHQVKLEVPLGQGAPMIMSSYKVNEEELLVFNSIQAPLKYVSIESPYYALYDYINGKEKQTFNLFDATPLSRFPEWTATTAFDLRDCMNNEKTSVCFVMGTMPVFGILDILSGKVRGFRLKDAPAFFTKENRLFFSGVCAQDKYIYALYLGKTGSELMLETGRTILYKIDWNGHILKKYELDGVFRGCIATQDKLYISKVEDNYNWGLYQLDINLL